MPRLPDGDPAPETGELPPEALATLAGSRLGMYVHVPFCAVRCGYCDFNTYTLTELGPGASTSTFVDSALAELDVAARVLGAGRRPGRHRLRRWRHAHAAARRRPRAVRRRHPGQRSGSRPTPR